jgi:hypothetical protein
MYRSRRNKCALDALTGNYHGVCSSVLLLALISSCGNVELDATSRAAPASDGAMSTNRFSDPFDTLNLDVWTCEYSCPTMSGGTATFSLLPGVGPSNLGSWSKIHYTPRRFTSGTFTVRFALGPRPTEPVWWGVALYEEGPSPDQSQYSEIYFGYRTDGSFTNTQLYLESARFGKNLALKVDTGVDLYDGTFHTGRLVYDSTRIELFFDDQPLQAITDTSVIPTVPMTFVLGTRLVTTPVLTSRFDEIINNCEIEW